MEQHEQIGVIHEVGDLGLGFQELKEGFCVGSIIKYVQRYDLKNGVEDLKKARFYLDTLIELKEKTLNN